MKKYHRNNIANTARVFDKLVAKVIRHQAGKFKREYSQAQRAAIAQYDIEGYRIHRWQAIHHARTALTDAQKTKLLRELWLRDELVCWWGYGFKVACMRACSKKPNQI